MMSSKRHLFLSGTFGSRIMVRMLCGAKHIGFARMSTVDSPQAPLVNLLVLFIYLLIHIITCIMQKSRGIEKEKDEGG